MGLSKPIYQRNPSVGQSTRGVRATPYELLMHQSRMLGRAAASANNLASILFYHPVAMEKKRTVVSERQFFEEHPDKIHKVVEQAHEILAGARTVVLPSNLFPDTVTIDRMKVTITEWEWLWSRRVVTLRIEDILNVAANLGMFFGSLTISTRVMNSTDHFVIRGFWNKDAIRLKRIIQGYMIALHQGIDVSELSTERLTRKLYELGDDLQVVK